MFDANDKFINLQKGNEKNKSYVTINVMINVILYLLLIIGWNKKI